MMTNSNVVAISPAKAGSPADQTDDVYSNREALIVFQKASNLTWTEIARRLDYSPAVLTQYRKRVYHKAGGDCATVNERVGRLLIAEQAYAALKRHDHEVVMTRQVQETIGVIDYLQDRAFGIFVGEAGIGKTVGMREYARQHPDSVLLMTLDPFKGSKFAFVDHVHNRIPGHHSKRCNASEKLNRIIKYYNAKHKTLLLDEAHWLTTESLEVARTIQDLTGIGIVLSGTFKLDEDMGFAGNIPRDAQLYSRVRIHRVISPEIVRDDLARVVALYGIHEPEIVDWLHARCNRVGRRYRWVDSVLQATYTFCEKKSVPLDLDAIQRAEKLTGLL